VLPLFLRLELLNQVQSLLFPPLSFGMYGCIDLIELLITVGIDPLFWIFFWICLNILKFLII
jgi:hypothetical protein